MWRNLASTALSVFVVLAFLIGGIVVWATRQYSAPGPLSQAICLQVPAGSTMKRVTDNLVAQGAVTYGPIYAIGTDYAGLNGQLKAGSFLVPAGASMSEIAGIVTRGGQSTCGTEIVLRIGVARNLLELRTLDPATGRFDEVARFDPAVEEFPAEYEELRAESETQYRVVVAEGVTAWQVMQGLNGFDVLANDVTDTPAEGMLAPDSYQVREGDDIAALLARMQAAQEAIMAAEWAGRMDGLPFSTPEEALTLASIIEKETGVAAERELVSSVLVNRLRTPGWKLQFDPTIIYGITRGEGLLDRPIRRSDIDGVTERELHGAVEYNTYVIEGLPPGPIAIPGRAAIRAALNPATTDYMFFVATEDGTGSHAFAATLDEHNSNVAAARETAAARAAAAAE